MRRGEVRWYKFRQPDKKRPVLVLTRDSALEFLGEVTIAPITSTIREIPTEVVLRPEDGLPRDCAINLDHLPTVSRGRLGAPVTTLPANKLEEVRKALLFALGLRYEYRQLGSLTPCFSSALPKARDRRDTSMNSSSSTSTRCHA